MRVLVCVKRTGENFIRHYFPAMTDFKSAYSAPDAISKIQSYRPDLVLFEWADSLCSQITQSIPFQQLKDRQKFKVVVRLHDHEVTREDQIAKFVAWRYVDAVWFINRAIQERFKKEINSRIQSFFIPNAVNPAPFPLSEKAHKRAGLLSIVFRPRKCFERVVHLAKACPDWSFHIRVSIPKPGERFYEYYRTVSDLAGYVSNVHFEHRDAVKMIKGGYDYSDLVGWYSDKAVILSTSRHEGFHYAVGEGMLTGAMPVVWNWATSGDFWGGWTVKSVNEAARRLNEYKLGRENEYRFFVEANYSPHVLWAQVVEKIEEI